MDNMYRLPTPSFESELTGLLFDIERLRANVGLGTTPIETYRELHALFSTVMSVISARIEGNHTTVFDALDNAQPTSQAAREDRFHEITNITEAALYLENLDPTQPFTHTMIRQLHALAVDGLTREGDRTPGDYRSVDVAIGGSQHVPPSWVTVHAEMSSLLDFANTNFPPHKQILQIALAHHRFVWIHPFTNGNGRVSRLFTYAMLRRTVFSTRGYSALNPTSVFGNDRSLYMSALEQADDLSEEGNMHWATFFAQGIRGDLKRVVALQDHDYVSNSLVGPVIDSLYSSGTIDSATSDILKLALRVGRIKSADLVPILGRDSSHRTRIIKKLLNQQLIKQSDTGPRFYTLSLARGPLAHRIIRKLDELGFMPHILADDQP